MLELAAAALLSGATILIAWVVYLYTLPWLMRLHCVYSLHSIRDRVFKLGLAFPRVRQTLFYRDIDSVIASSIHMVRDGGVAEALMFMSMMSPKNRPSDQKTAAGWRLSQLQFELKTVFVGPDGNAAFKELTACARETDKVVFQRALTGHPVVFFLAVAAILVALPISIVRELLKRRAPKQGVPRKDAQNAETARAEVQSLSEVIRGFENPPPFLLPKLRAPGLFYNRIAQRNRIAA